MKIQESSENYLEAIYMIKQRAGVVRSIDVAAELEFSKPSVSIAMKKLRENGYVNMDSDGLLTLTDSGLEIAKKMYERHLLISDWLKSLGVSEENAVNDACRIEHVISTETFEALKKHFGEGMQGQPYTVERFFHTFDPVFSVESEILILGSFPSVRSREQGFYYAHPQNRFWKVLAFLFEEDIPQDIGEKRDFILKHKLALWDVVASCEIKGSADSSMRSPLPNDIAALIRQTAIKLVFTNGQTAQRLYTRLVSGETQIKAVCLPSTSPANAACSLEKLCDKWSIIKTALKL